MQKKENTIKKISGKANNEKELLKKVVAKKAKELSEWNLKNADQKRFFWLEEKEQEFLETTYMIVLQMCPGLEWEEFLNRLRKATQCNTWIKTIIKNKI